MKKYDAIKRFGTQSKSAEDLNVSQAAISKWPEDIPPLRAYQIEQLTQGALKAEVELHNENTQAA